MTKFTPNQYNFLARFLMFGVRRGSYTDELKLLWNSLVSPLCTNKKIDQLLIRWENTK